MFSEQRKVCLIMNEVRDYFLLNVFLTYRVRSATRGTYVTVDLIKLSTYDYILIST